MKKSLICILLPTVLMLTCAACTGRAPAEQSSEAEASGSAAGSQSSEAGAKAEGPAQKALEGDTADERCREIVTMFFDYAAEARRTGSDPKLMPLTDNNEKLLEAQRGADGLLNRDKEFTCEFSFQDCGEISQNIYYVNVNEIRATDSDRTEYAHTFTVIINSATDYCISDIDSMAAEPDLPVPVEGADGEYYDPSPDLPPEEEEEEETDALRMQRDYKENAEIPEPIFSLALQEIEAGNYEWSLGDNHAEYAASRYEYACSVLEDNGYQDTPLHRLASDLLWEAWLMSFEY